MQLRAAKVMVMLFLVIGLTEPLPAQQPIVERTLGSLKKFIEHRPQDLAISPDGKTIAAACRGKILIYDVASGKLVREFEAHGYSAETVSLCRFTADGRKLVTAISRDRGLIKVWNTSDYSPASEVPSTNCHTIDIHPNGKLLATKNNDGIVLWNLATKEKAQSFGKLPISSVQFSGDGSHLVSTAYAGATVWDYQAGKGKRVKLVVGSDGKQTMTPTAAAIQKKAAGTIPANMTIYCAALDHDAKHLAVAGRRGYANIGQLWHVADRKMVKEFTDEATSKEVSNIDMIRFLKGRPAILFLTSHRFGCWNYESDKLAFAITEKTRMVEHAPVGTVVKSAVTPFTSFDLSPDGSTLVTAGSSPIIRVWRLPK